MPTPRCRRCRGHRAAQAKAPRAPRRPGSSQTSKPQARQTFGKMHDQKPDLLPTSPKHAAKNQHPDRNMMNTGAPHLHCRGAKVGRSSGAQCHSGGGPAQRSASNALSHHLFHAVQFCSESHQEVLKPSNSRITWEETPADGRNQHNQAELSSGHRTNEFDLL